MKRTKYIGHSVFEREEGLAVQCAIILTSAARVSDSCEDHSRWTFAMERHDSSFLDP